MRGRVYKRELFQVRNRGIGSGVLQVAFEPGLKGGEWRGDRVTSLFRTLETSRKSICPNNRHRFMGKVSTIVSSLPVTIRPPSRSRNNYVVEACYSKVFLGWK